MANGNDDISKTSGQFSQDMSSASHSMKGMMDALSSFGKGQIFSSLKEDVRALANELERSKNLMRQIQKGEVDYGRARQKSAKVSQLNEKIRQKSAKLEDQILQKLKNRSGQEAKNFKQQVNGLNDIGNKATQSFKRASQFAKKGETSWVKMADGLQKSLKAGGYTKAAAGAGGVAKGMRAAAVAGKGLGQSMKWVLKLIPTLLKGLATFLGPLSWIFTIPLFLYDVLKFVLKINSEVVGISKGLTISRTEARSLRKSFQRMSYLSTNMRNNYHVFIQQHSTLNDILNTQHKVIRFGILDGMATLQNRMGLTVEAASGFALLAINTTGSTEEIADNVMRGAINMNKMYGGVIDVQKVLDEVGKTSGELRAVYFGIEEALGDAVTTSLALGQSLAKIHKQSRGILNFESSIAKEIEAELFLQKDLNLERMRAARLTNDMVVYQEELIKAAGSYQEFTEMNTLARESLAAALEMETDQLEDMLFKMMTQDELMQLQGTRHWEQAKAMMMQRDLSQQFADIMLKLKYILVDIFDGMEEWKIPEKVAKFFNVSRTPFADDNIERIAKKLEQDVMLGGDTTNVLPREMQDGNIQIKTAARDQVALMVGSRLWGNNQNQEHVVAAIDRNTEAVFQDKHILWDQWGSVNASNHLSHNSDRWVSS